MLTLAYTDRYPLDLPATHSFPHRKYELLIAQLLYLGIVRQEQLWQPVPLLPYDIILRAHTTNYWMRLQGLALSPAEVRRIGLPLSRQLVSRAHASATNTYYAAEQALVHGIAFHLGGGTHHAYADRAEGYCLLNDVAISIRNLMQQGRIHRPLVVDLDVHQGNGTAVIFQDEPAVFTFSMHAEHNYPRPKARSSLDIGLPDGTTDDAYLALLDEHLPRILAQHRPDMLYYIAGSDVLATDRLGRLALTHAGAMARDERVLTAAYRLGIPCCVTLGGGYSADIRNSIDANCNTVRVATHLWD